MSEQEQRPIRADRSRVFRAAAICLGAAIWLMNPAAPARAEEAGAAAKVIIAVGAAGEAEFGTAFAQWADDWRHACQLAGGPPVIIGLTATNSESDVVQLHQAIAREPTNSPAALWLVLLGHGTFDGREAKFNLRGPDLTAAQLAAWLKPFARPVVIVNCAAASSPFLNELSGRNRIVITATRSGAEENFARLGKFLAKAVIDPRADLDKDGQTSVLEAFLLASRQTTEFYESEGRLATEHALLDDNGDGLGTTADFFRGIRAVKSPANQALPDGPRANQIHLLSSAGQRVPPETQLRRDELELAIARLRESRSHLPEDEYYRRLEVLLLELAALTGSP